MNKAGVDVDDKLLTSIWEGYRTARSMVRKSKFADEEQGRGNRLLSKKFVWEVSTNIYQCIFNGEGEYHLHVTEIDDEGEKIGHRRAYHSCQAEKGQVSAMVPRIIALAFAGLVFSQSAWAVVLENPTPGSIKSGVGVISGWICEAAELEISFNGGLLQFVPYGSERVDTEPVCGDTDNGFGLLINYNNLGNGPQTVTLYADGEVATQVHFNVQTLGTDFLRGRTGQGAVELSDGKHVALQWEETTQGFAITDYNYTGVFPGQERPQACTPTSTTGTDAPTDGQCSPYGPYCQRGSKRDIPDTETHERFECVGLRGGTTDVCEEEKPHLDRFNGEWQFVFSYEWTCDLADFRFLCTITDGMVVCGGTERRFVDQQGQVDTYTLMLAADVSQAGNLAGEITITGSTRIADGSVVAWVEGGRIGFGTWGPTAAQGCGGTWSATRR